MIMSEITSIFKHHNIEIVQAQVEPVSEAGTKHTYFVKSVKTAAKLSNYEMERVREDLEKVIHSHDESETASGSMVGVSTGSEDDTADGARLQRVEAVLAMEQESNRKIHEQLEATNKRLDTFLDCIAQRHSSLIQEPIVF